MAGSLRFAPMVTVAIDSGPLHGPRTGIGNAVAWTFDALRSLPPADAVELRPYVVSMRAAVTPPERRLPIPAAVAHRVWARTSMLRADRLLGHPDVVHGTNYVVPPARAPRLVTVYDCWFLDHPEHAHPDVARAGEILRRAVDTGATVVTSSTATTDRVGELLGVDAVTIHLGAPPSTSPPESRPATLPPHLDDDPFVLALGTVEHRKNLPLLVQAFALLAREHERVRLVIAGRDGDDAAALDSALGELPGDAAARVDRVRFLDEPAKHWLLHHAVALAYPSLDEGFGFPALEAQLAETAVVASSAGSIPEVAGSGALLSLPSDAHALAANLHWVVTSESRRNELIDLGRLNVARFSWDDTARHLADLYRRVAEEA